MEFDVKIDGLKELDKALAGLGAEVGAKALKGALMSASKPMLDEMKQNVPVSSGGLKKGLGRRSKTNKKGKWAKTSAIVRVGAVKKSGWRAHLIEFGTSRTRAQPFIRPALDKSNEAITIFQKRLKIIIDREAKKQNKP